MLRLLISILVIGTVLTACGGSKTDVVDSGTYTGTLEEVVPEESEIYLSTDEDQLLELYFIDETTLTQAGDTVDFSVLEKGQRVEVEVKKVGKQLDPISVRILE